MKNFTILTVAIALSSTLSMAQTVSAKFGKGIKFTSADTSFSVKFRYRQQQLFETTFSEDVNGDYNSESNFMVRRSRLKFSGHAFTPKLTYKAELGLTGKDISVSKEDGNGGGSSRLILDAVLKYQFAEHWAVWVGQTKLPGNRERVISSANLQFVNRSNLNSKFNIDRDAGIQLRGNYSLGNAIVKPSIAITKGEGRDVTSENYGGYDYTAHLDFLPFGKFANKKGDYISSDLERNESPKLAIGLTYDFNHKSVRQGGQLGSFVSADSAWDAETGLDYVENSMQSFIADMFFKYKGVSLMSAYAARAGDNSDYNGSYNIGTAFNSQIGYLFESNWEIAGRFTMVRKADASNLSSQNEYTLGLSKYIKGHALKLQSDISRVETLNSDLEQYRFRMQMEMQF